MLFWINSLEHLLDLLHQWLSILFHFHTYLSCITKDNLPYISKLDQTDEEGLYKVDRCILTKVTQNNKLVKDIVNILYIIMNSCQTLCRFLWEKSWKCFRFCFCLFFVFCFFLFFFVFCFLFLFLYLCLFCFVFCFCFCFVLFCFVVLTHAV